MSNQYSGFSFFILVILVIVSFIGGGMLAWDKVEPESFFGVVCFLIVWSIFTSIGYYLSLFIVGILSTIFED